MKKIFIALFISLAVPFGQVLAACPTGIVPCGGEGCPCGFCHIFQLVFNLINFFLVPCGLNNNIALIPLLATLMLVIGGLVMLSSGSNPGRFEKAKSILTATVVGLVIVFAAWVFLNTFFVYIDVAEWTGLENWWQIKCP